MSLRIPDAARRLSIDPKVLRGMAVRGEVPCTKLGKVWVFDETLLDDWLRARCQENLKQCPSNVQSAPRISGKSGSGSLAAKLEGLLAATTNATPKSSRSDFAVISGGKTN